VAHVYYHARTNVRMFGGKIEDYLPIHQQMDSSKESFADYRHRAVYHHAEGCFEMEKIFGVCITNSDGKEVPVRLIAEAHCMEDLGRIPNRADWLSCIKPESWMARSTPIRMAHGTRGEPE